MTSFGRVISVRGSLARVGLLAATKMGLSEVRATVGRFVSIRCATCRTWRKPRHFDRNTNTCRACAYGAAHRRLTARAARNG